MGHYDSRGNYSPTPTPCLPLPPRHVERSAPPSPPPYDGDFYSQPKRVFEYEQPVETCHIGLKFIWSNGERLATGLPCSIIPASGEVIRARLDEYARFIGDIPDGAYQAKMLADFDLDKMVFDSRAQVQATLESILVAERAEAAELKAIQDERSFITNAFYTHLAVGKGALYGAWGMVKSLADFGDLINPFTYFSNVVVSAWNADASNGGSWVGSFRDNFSAEHHRELVEAFGFDPGKVTREQLAEAYEYACFIAEDEPSRQMLARFAVDYALAQNHEEVAEFGGGAVFEIVFAALLILFTGGAGIAVSARLLPLVERLGAGLKRLGQSLRNARIQKAGRVEGKGTGAQIKEIERPKEITKTALAATVLRDWSHLTLSERHFLNKVTRPKAAGNTVYTVPREVVLRDLKEIHTQGEKIRKGEKFETSSGRVYGLHGSSIHPVSGPGTVNLNSQQYGLLVLAKRRGREKVDMAVVNLLGKGEIKPAQVAEVVRLLDLPGRGELK